MPTCCLGLALCLAALAASTLMGGESDAAEPRPSTAGKASVLPDEPAGSNRTDAPDKEPAGGGGGGGGATFKSTFDNLMIQRALYVLIGVTAVVVVYFVIRTISVGKRSRRNKRYGVLSTSAEHIELAALDQEDDDDEDTTLFEAHQGRR